jgi:hypothetical protein
VHFPKLNEEKCSYTSRQTSDYNCVGLVTGDYLWWHPEDRHGHHWPDSVVRRGFALDYVKALETVRFEVCPDETQNDTPEAGYQKIVMFHQGGLFKHVAIQLSPNLWKSKMGELEDLEHPLDIDECQYGKIFKFLRRPLQFAGGALPDEYRI